MNLNAMPLLPRSLLDKGVLRHYLQGLWNAEHGRSVTVDQEAAIALVLLSPADALFASTETLNLAKRAASTSEWSLLASRVRLFIATRYQRRWRRRLRWNFGFGREDAHQVALSSFGEDNADRLFGTCTFVTFDLRLVRRFETHHEEIAAALNRMTCQLPLPYRDAALPEVVTPQAVLPALAA